MSPDLAHALDVARELAWMPTANLGGKAGAMIYRTRYELHQTLIGLVAEVRLPRRCSDELRLLWSATERVSRCTFSNRMGLPYYERRQAVAQLRGAFAVWDRADQPVARPTRRANMRSEEVTVMSQIASARD